jgi:hypothetical protein
MNKKALIEHMVNRFLGWKIPETFGPDAGVSFDKAYKEKWGMPTGTNIFTGREAEQLFEYALEGFAATPVSTGADAKGEHSHPLHVPTVERVRSAHTQMPAAAWVGTPHEGTHRTYKQSVDESCYLCALLAEIDSLKADAKDAARYRWLRNRVVILDGSTAGMTIIDSIVAQPLDRTIDNANAAMSDEAGKV